MDMTFSDPSGSVFKYLFPCVCAGDVPKALVSKKLEAVESGGQVGLR